MSAPTVSVFCSAIRTKKWMRLYKSLTKNETPFEIIFVGDRKPKFKLPPNFRFIYSRVKPAQCCHIAISSARGKFIMLAQDDLVFGKKALDKVVARLDKSGDDTIACPAYYTYRKWKDRKKRIRTDFFGQGNLDHPILTVAPMMTKDLWNKVGGIDKRFVCSYWDCDVTMRVHEMGGNVVVEESAECIEIKEKRNHSVMPSDPVTEDIRLFYSLWIVHKDKPNKRYTPDNRVKVKSYRNNPYIPVRTRSAPVDPIVDRKDILTKSQGPKYKWK